MGLRRVSFGGIQIVRLIRSRPRLLEETSPLGSARTALLTLLRPGIDSGLRAHRAKFAIVRLRRFSNLPSFLRIGKLLAFLLSLRGLEYPLAGMEEGR